MKKLLAFALAAVFAGVTVSGYAQEKKKEEPKKEANKGEQ
jgi:hypothetical protein